MPLDDTPMDHGGGGDDDHDADVDAAVEMAMEFVENVSTATPVCPSCFIGHLIVQLMVTMRVNSDKPWIEDEEQISIAVTRRYHKYLEQQAEDEASGQV